VEGTIASSGKHAPAPQADRLEDSRTKAARFPESTIAALLRKEALGLNDFLH